MNAPIALHPIRAIEPAFLETYPQARNLLKELTKRGVTFLEPVHDGDLHEESYEAAALLLAALERMGDLELVDYRTANLTDYDGRPLIGNHPIQCGYYRLKPSCFDTVGSYGSSAAFSRYAGRRIEVITWNEDDGFGACHAALEEWLEHGPLFVKNAIIKGPVLKADTMDDLLAKVPLMNPHYSRVALLVQDFVQMEHELRLFVVDGRIVTHSPRAEDLHPGIADSTILESVPVGTNRTKANLVHNPELVTNMLREAQKILPDLIDDLGERSFVLDVAVINQNGESKVVAVELNTISQSGYFAANPAHVIDAFNTARESMPTLQVTDLSASFSSR